MHSGKLICHSLPKSPDAWTQKLYETASKKIPEINLNGFYINPSLLRAVGTEHILPHQTFNPGQLMNDYTEEISKTAKDFFNINLSTNIIKEFGLKTKDYLEDSKEFYRVHGIYFSNTPLPNYDNFMVLDVPEAFVQASPQRYPLVAGELSLKYATCIIVKKNHLSDTQIILSKANNFTPILSYYNDIDELKL
jgi:hypothetical protein